MLIYHLYLNADGTIHHVDAYDGVAPAPFDNWTPPVSNTPILFAENMDYDKLIIHAYKGDQ